MPSSWTISFLASCRAGYTSTLMRPPLFASATSLNLKAEVVNGLSLPTIVASLSVTVCARAAEGASRATAVRNTRKGFIDASTVERVGPGGRSIVSHATARHHGPRPAAGRHDVGGVERAGRHRGPPSERTKQRRESRRGRSQEARGGALEVVELQYDSSSRHPESEHSRDPESLSAGRGRRLLDHHLRSPLDDADCRR